jgi:uncharacterized protein (DUF2236 family)
VRDIARVGDGPAGTSRRRRLAGARRPGHAGGRRRALLGQGAHPLALGRGAAALAYQLDPWKRLAGTARWLVVSTFGSDELARAESRRVRGLHSPCPGQDDAGRAYAASDPVLLRWVHLAFTDAFLAAHLAVARI